MIMQLIWGSAVLIACTLLHVLLLIAGIRLLRRLAHSWYKVGQNPRMVLALSTAVGVILIAHSLQVWIWAVSFVALGALPDIATAVYFGLVTYTTLGYGDITLTEPLRLYASMAAITGLLNFGLSTAFLIAVFSKAIPPDLLE